jgi:2-C-methyl-D-erythritol 2,4-cyclodiphosphate synthase
MFAGWERLRPCPPQRTKTRLQPLRAGPEDGNRPCNRKCASATAGTRTNSSSTFPLKIGGVTLPHPRGLSGHSDGDVLLHAITDALLGAIAGPDIGSLFPPSDPSGKMPTPPYFFARPCKRVKRAGYALVNLDSVLILSTPKIGPHTAAIRKRVAELCGIAPDCIGIKAKTPEGIGTENAAIASVTVLLQRADVGGGG